MSVAALGRQGSQVISRSLRQVIRCKRQHSKWARSFRGQKILKPGQRMHFFPQKSWRPFLVVALKTQAANAADCFTVKIKQIKWSDMVTFLLYCSHYYRSKVIGAGRSQGGGSSSQVIDFARPGVAPPLIHVCVERPALMQLYTNSITLSPSYCLQLSEHSAAQHLCCCCCCRYYDNTSACSLLTLLRRKWGA